MNSKAILLRTLDHDRMYLAEQIRRRLRDAGHPEDVFEEALRMEWLVMIDKNPREEFWCVKDSIYREWLQGLSDSAPRYTGKAPDSFSNIQTDTTMAIYAEAGSSIPKLDDGSYLARCCQMVEIGTVTESYEGQKPKASKKVRLIFEVIGETYETKEGETKPRTVAKTYTLSMNEKATLRKDLEAWRTKKFTDEEAKKFDVVKLLGKPCALTLVANAKGYPEISAIAAPTKGVTVPELSSPAVELSYEKWDELLFEQQPEFIRNMMQKTPEYAKLKGLVAPPTLAPTLPIGAEEEDELPF